ncbi:hypothetical protein WCE41_00555 [Luteimonas sp. MJ246]|uniref:hypothetical protein n=1 Tax=Luteimonas sp. MJ174 TaxID=3129237 RepID=UPI0031B9F4FB
MTTHSAARWLAPLALALLAGCGPQDGGSATGPMQEPATPVAASATGFAPMTLPAMDPAAVARCSVDKVDGQPRQQAVPVVAGGSVVVEGWVADAALKVPAAFSVVLTGPGTYAIPGEAGVAREDVASALASPDLARAGFGVSGALSAVPAGEYAVELLVAHGDGRSSLCPTGVRLAVGQAD